MSDKEKLKEEVRLLREQLTRIAEKIDSEDPQETEEEEVDAAHDEPLSDKEETPTEEEEEPEWHRNSYSEMYRNSRRQKHWDPFGERLGNYIGDFVNEIMENVGSELEHTVFIDRGGRRDRPTMITDREVKRTTAIMSAMGNEHRIKILRELSWGGLYSSDLQQHLKEISPSTLSSHLDVLEQAGLIHQERRRGRYLITMSGRIAIKLAAQLAKQAEIKIKFE